MFKKYRVNKYGVENQPVFVSFLEDISIDFVFKF